MNDKAKKAILEQTKTIAILGLSPNEDKPSFQVAKFLQTRGYQILPIYPKGGEILGVRAFLDLKDAFSDEVKAQYGEIKILNVFRKSEALLEIAKEVLNLTNPPMCVWVQLGLSNPQAKALLEDKGFLYEEDSCIKLEYERLFV